MQSPTKDITGSFRVLQEAWSDIIAKDFESDSIPFQRMLHEWLELCNRDSEDVVEWNTHYNAMLKEQRFLMNQGVWISGPADFLTIIGQSRHELFHSFFLAWLLDPGMPHGLGDKLLKKTLEHCFPDPDGNKFSSDLLNGAVAKCEVSEARSRADIIISASQLHIVIEVKIDARERDRQCEDLFADHAGKEGAKFIFLTPNGREPKSAPGEIIAEYGTISLKEIREYLAGLLTEIEQKDERPAGYASAKTYLQTLKKEF